MNALVNGIVSEEIAVSDRGLQYGDGVFETIAVIEGQCEHWVEHMERLSAGCKQIKLPSPDVQKLLVEAQQIIDGKQQAILKIIITRGSGGRGYLAPDLVSPTRILTIHPWPNYPTINSSLGIQLHLCDTQLSHQPALAGIKHLNRLEQVIARNEWNNPDISEGLMCDNQGNVIEGTMSNVFVVINNELVTPEIVNCGVAGIMRSHIMRQANILGIPMSERNLALNDVLSADEVFVCNSIIRIWPVRQLLDKHYKVVGDITAQIMNGLI